MAEIKAYLPLSVGYPFIAFPTSTGIQGAWGRRWNGVGHDPIGWHSNVVGFYDMAHFKKNF